ncbi:MAG: Asp23/Gls24 family envelope stress response protein [Clostridiales bacterium]|nr:Asp23/Gls24 family envelope stress response protein [Clostridiales bacterium]
MEKNYSDESGTISYSRGILNNIATLAVQEVKGVASLYKGSPRKPYSGVKLEFVDSGAVIVDIAVNIFYGYSVSEVAYQIQENVKSSIESMTDFKVQAVNVDVLAVTFGSETVS